MKTDKNLYLGIDIGGSSVKYGWGNPSDGLLYFDKVHLNGTSLESLTITVNKIMGIVNKEIGLQNIIAIGVGTPGTINLKTGKLEGVNPNLQEWVNIDPKIIFPAELRDKIKFENDANLMALAEASCLPEVHNLIGITIGSGIGCGWVIDGQIYHGAHGYAMELGHNIVEVNGIKCNCGKRGCLEAYASVNGLLNRVNSNKEFMQLENMQDILNYSRQNLLIKGYLKESIQYLSLAISNLLINLDSGALIIGGGVIENPEFPYIKLERAIVKGFPHIQRDKIIVRKAIYGNWAGVMGALLISSRD
jgi:glucokinase